MSLVIRKMQRMVIENDGKVEIVLPTHHLQTLIGREMVFCSISKLCDHRTSSPVISPQKATC